jgi:hypothetical protein
MEPLPGDAKRWTVQFLTPGKDFVLRQEVTDEQAKRLEIGSVHPQASQYANYKLAGFEPAQRGSQWAYYLKTYEAQWAYNLEHASTTGDSLPTLRYTWVIPRSEYQANGRTSVPTIPSGQMPTWGGAYTWRFVGERMQRFSDYLDGLFVQVIHDYWDTEHPLRSEEIDRDTGRKVTVLRELVAADTQGHGVNTSGEIATYESINEHCGWLTTRKAGGLLGNLVNGKAVRIQRGVKPHYWPRVLGSLSVYPVYSDPRDIYSEVVGYNTARKFKAEEYNSECTITIVETVTTKEPIFGGDPDWNSTSPSNVSPEIPRPVPLLTSGIHFSGVELKVFCEDCLRQGFEFYDSGWKEFFPATEFINWPSSRLTSVDVRQENGVWVTESVFVDAPQVGQSSGLDLYQRNTAEPTSVEVRWTPQTASGALHPVRIDVATSGDFSRGFLPGFRNKLVTPGTNSPVDSWTTITGMVRGALYFVRLTRTPPTGAATTSNTLIVTGRASPELTWRRAGVDVLNGSTVNFGPVEVGQTGRVTVTLASIGLITVGGVEARISGAGELVYGHDLPPATMIPGQTQELELRFSPTAIGSIAATLTVDSDAEGTPHTLELTGIGAASEIALEQPEGTDLPSGGSLAFGTVTTGTISKVFKLLNTGNAPLRNISATITGPDLEDFTFTSPLTVTELAAGGAAFFTVLFDPIENEDAFGTRTAVLSIASNDGNENPMLINLSGINLSPTAPGTLDPAFNAATNGLVRALVTQADGKILVAGDFTTVAGTARNRIGRVNANGTLDTGFNPNANGVVRCMQVQPDGTILIGGDFTSIGGTTRNRIALLNADGTLNSWYPTGGCDAGVWCIARKANGSVWIGGPFNTVGGSTRKRIALINADASINSTNPSVALGISIPAVADVRSIVLDETERLIISGYYFQVFAWGFVARLLANGDVDGSFIGQVYFNGPVNSVAVRSDGRVVAGGSFTTMSTVTGTFPSIAPGAPVLNRANVIVLSSSGVPTEDLLDANGEVHVCALQSDGKVHIGGAFTTLAGSARLRLARLLPDMRLEAAWDPQADAAVRAFAQQGDGLLLIGGDFANVLGTSRAYLARIQNNSAISTLTVVNASLVDWQRAGALAETVRVVWQVDTGSGYGALAGVTTRTSGGWQLVPTSALSGTGNVRVLALPTDSHSSGANEAVKAFNFSPEIVVELGGVDTASGGTLAFGDVQSGVTQDLPITIRNVGLSTLTISSVTITGTAAARYTKTDPAFSIAPLTSSVCTVRFSPTTLGAQPAVLTIASNDSDEASFVVNLLGTATAGPGRVDSTWQPTVTGSIDEIVLRGSEVLIGGAITAINSQARKWWGRINTSTAAVEVQPSTTPDRAVGIIIPLLDGRYILGTSGVDTAARVWLVSATGVRDTSFSLTIVGALHSGCLMPDGSVIIVGPFNKVNGITRDGSFRLLPETMKLDPAFNPYGNGYLRSVVPDSAGGVWLEGLGAAGTGRLSATGQFVVSSALQGFPLAPTAEGGVYLLINSTQIKKILPDGTADNTFSLTTGYNITDQFGVRKFDLLAQVDGRVIVSAYSNAETNRRLRRFNPVTGAEATLDTTWVSDVVISGSAYAQDNQGRVYAALPQLKRLLNAAGSEALSAPSSSRVTWLRSGTVPEVCWVRLDLSEDGGSTWRHLGLCTRMTGGWEKTGLALPLAGRLRVQAYTGSALITAEQVYSGLAVPDLVIERANVVQAEGATVSFAGRIAGGTQTSDVTLTLRNTGNADLTGLVAAVSASDFTVVSLGLPGQADPTRLTPLQETQLVLRFTPTLTGVRAGALTITSNVPGAKGRVTLQLRGNGVTNPVATTQAATAITHVVAQLNAAFTANDDTATVSIEYKRSIDTNWISIALDPVSGFTATTRLANVGTLSASTAYEVRTKIVNSLSTQFGSVRTFTTSPPP